MADLTKEYGDSIAGDRISVVEVFLNPPDGLGGSSANRLVWSFVVDRGAVTVSREELHDPIVRVEVDYNSVLPIARQIYPTDPDTMRLRREARLASMKDEDRRKYESVSPAMQRMMVEFHNRMAAVTL